MVEAIAAAPGLGWNEFPHDNRKVSLVVTRSRHRPCHRPSEDRTRGDRLLLGHHVEPKSKELRKALGALELLKDQDVLAEWRCQREPVFHLSPACRGRGGRLR